MINLNLLGLRFSGELTDVGITVGVFALGLAALAVSAFGTAVLRRRFHYARTVPVLMPWELPVNDKPNQ